MSTKKTKNWFADRDEANVFHRAGGRRQYNARRQAMADKRRLEVSRLLAAYGIITWGAKARIARELGVSAATISRDVAVLMRTCTNRTHRRCPTCGTLVLIEPQS